MKKISFLHLAILCVMLLNTVLLFLFAGFQKDLQHYEYQLAGIKQNLDRIDETVNGLAYWQDDTGLIAQRSVSFGTYQKEDQQIPVTVTLQPGPSCPAEQAALTLNGDTLALEKNGDLFEVSFPLSIQETGQITAVTFQGAGREQTAKVYWTIDPKEQVMPRFYSKCIHIGSGTLQTNQEETPVTGELAFAVYDIPAQAGQVEQISLLEYRNEELTQQKQLSFHLSNLLQKDAVSLTPRLNGTIPKGGTLTYVIEVTDANGFRYRHTALVQSDGPTTAETNLGTQVFDRSGTHLFDL